MSQTREYASNERRENDDRLPDYHLHTVLCNHATGEVVDYRNVAKEKGIPEICFADHAPNPDGYDPQNRMHMNEFSVYREIVGAQMDKRAPEVLIGLEADYYDGCEVFLKQWLDDQHLDLVLGSVHYIDTWGFDNPSAKRIWNSVNITDTWRNYFSLVERLVETGLFDVLGHLDLPKKFGHRPPENEIKEMVQPLLDKVAKSGMGMEINTSGLRKPVKEIYPSRLIVSLARERDIPICFGSDAHGPGDVGRGFNKALQLAKEAGYGEYFRIRNRKKYLVPFPETI